MTPYKLLRLGFEKGGWNQRHSVAAVGRDRCHVGALDECVQHCEKATFAA